MTTLVWFVMVAMRVKHHEMGSYLRLIDSCITQRVAQGPKTCNESKEEGEEGDGGAVPLRGGGVRVDAALQQERSFTLYTFVLAYTRSIATIGSGLITKRGDDLVPEFREKSLPRYLKGLAVWSYLYWGWFSRSLNRGYLNAGWKRRAPRNCL